MREYLVDFEIFKKRETLVRKSRPEHYIKHLEDQNSFYLFLVDLDGSLLFTEVDKDGIYLDATKSSGSKKVDKEKILEVWRIQHLGYSIPIMGIRDNNVMVRR